METKEKTTNREQALQERMKAETENTAGIIHQLYAPFLLSSFAGKNESRNGAYSW